MPETMIDPARLDDGHTARDIVGGSPPGPECADDEPARRRNGDPPPVARPVVEARITEHPIRDHSGEPEVAEPEHGKHADDDGERQQLSIPQLVDEQGGCHVAAQR